MIKPKYGAETARHTILTVLQRDPAEVRPQDLNLNDFIALFNALGPVPEQR